MNPTITVITVVYNAEKYIDKTIRSVINQTFQDKEYILIDGQSTDQTLSIINKYKEHISCIISEPDKGHFDAMNKALRRAKGAYILFLHAGDELFEEDTLSNIFNKKRDVDIYYGETVMVGENGHSLGKRNIIPKQLVHSSFRFGTTVSHQAFFVKRNLCPNYNLKYKVSSDIDWMLQILKNSPKTQPCNFFTTKYLYGGINKQRHMEALKERFYIMLHHYGVISTLLQHGVIFLRKAAEVILRQKKYK